MNTNGKHLGPVFDQDVAILEGPSKMYLAIRQELAVLRLKIYEENIFPAMVQSNMSQS
jgi:hypothetical protein